jgi:hypothetical protein
VVAIDVADGGAFAEVHGLGPDGIPAIAGTDAAEHGSVIGAAERCGRGRVCKPSKRGHRGKGGVTGKMGGGYGGGGIGEVGSTTVKEDSAVSIWIGSTCGQKMLSIDGFSYVAGAHAGCGKNRLAGVIWEENCATA